jgi:exosome complex RNA-binding protein Rrp42 (RNase PH superfamily)
MNEYNLKINKYRQYNEPTNPSKYKFNHQEIYKTYQTKEYYNRYFTQLKLREDSREFSQARDIKITIRNNTVAVSKGQTIVICQLATQV